MSRRGLHVEPVGHSTLDGLANSVGVLRRVGGLTAGLQRPTALSRYLRRRVTTSISTKTGRQNPNTQLISAQEKSVFGLQCRYLAARFPIASWVGGSVQAAFGIETPCAAVDGRAGFAVLGLPTPTSRSAGSRPSDQCYKHEASTAARLPPTPDTAVAAAQTHGACHWGAWRRHAPPRQRHATHAGPSSSRGASARPYPSPA